MPKLMLPLLKQHREGKGWNYIQLADTAGVNRTTTRHAETEPVTPGVARKLAAALGTSVQILAGQKTFLDLNI